MPKSEVDFLVDYLFDGPDGHAAAARIDRRVDRLPGQAALHLLETAVTRSSRQSTAASSALPTPAAPHRDRLA
jgi:hypothetical protein